MRRFVYSPSVSAYIRTDSGIMDVSADIISGSVTRRVNAVSNATLELQNPNRKYSQKFKPMDRIVIYLTRVKPMLVFSGYLDAATMDQLYPGPINLRASCTLKRLLYTYWDPTLSYVQAFFQKHGWSWDILTGNIYDNAGRSLFDLDMENGLGDMLRVVLNEVGGWPIGRQGENKNTVHVLQLPKRFLEKTESMIARQVEATEEQRQYIENFLKQLLTVEGVFSDPFAPSGENYVFNSKYSDNNPAPASLGGNYRARIYGKPINYDASSVPPSMNTAMRNARLQYGAEAAAAAAKYGVPQHIFFGLIRRESGWGTIEGGGVNEKNFANAHGLTQVVPPKYGYESAQILGNAQLQLDIGAHYLSDMFKTFKDWKLALAAYNAGPGNVEKYGGIPPFAETRAYVPAVLEYATEEQNAAKKNQSENTKPDGSPGEVTVGNNKFFKYINEQRPELGSTQTTFRIKGNPYGDDKMIFKATKYDPRLDQNEISIYVPGGTPQATQWNDRTVVVETSAGRATRFEKPAAANAPATGNTIADNVVKIANAEAAKGIREVGSTNSGAEIRKYQATTGAYNTAWCGSFVTWVFLQAGVDIRKRVSNPAAVVNITQAAEQNSWTVAVPQPGDIVTFGRDDHVGIVTKVVGDTIHTVEGNTSNGVYPRSHSQGVREAIYVRYPGVGSPSTGTSLVSDDPTAQQYGATGVNINADTVAEVAASINLGLPLVFPFASSEFESRIFKGERSLMNDVPLMEFVEFMAKASGRHFQSMPNGDFLAFYPDYFNWSKTSPYLRISDIETMDLNIEISDDRLATHVFTTADSMTPNGEIDWTDKLASTVSSVESIDTFREFVNVQDFDATKFLQRYGARPFVTPDALNIKNSFMQFMYGWMTFLEHWAEMFTATPTFTFMPELYPGGVVEFASKDLAMYINGVTHNFSAAGGYTTTADLIAPSTTSSQFNYGMVLTDGGYTKKVQQATP